MVHVWILLRPYRSEVSFEQTQSPIFMVENGLKMHKKIQEMCAQVFKNFTPSDNKNTVIIVFLTGYKVTMYGS